MLAYDGATPTTITGTVVNVLWQNPHAYIDLDVAADGTHARWIVENEGPAALERLGWTKTTLTPRDVITITGARARDGSTRMRCATITLADARRLPCFASTLTAQQAAPAYRPPRLRNGTPDLQGIWQVRNTAHWNLQAHGGSYKTPAGLGVVVDPPDGSIPYRPEALAIKERNWAARETADPMEKCYLAGVPRTMYLPYPLQILQTETEVVILSEYVHTWRWIPLTPLDRYPGYESWMGDPRGRWDGDTLVIETVGHNDQTWFDHAGNFHSDALKVTERLRRTADDVITYEATMDDPKVFTHPWTIRMPLYRHRDMDRILENECYLYAEEAGKPIRGEHPK